MQRLILVACHRQQLVAQGLLGVVVAVDESHFGGQFAHAGDEVDQVVLAGVGGVAADGVDLGADVIAFAVEVHVAAFWAVLLDRAAGGAVGLVADEQDIVAWIFDHRLEVVDDAAAGGHAAGGQHHRRAAGAGQVVDGLEVFCVTVDGVEILEGQRVAAGAHALVGFGVPPGFELNVGGGEAGGQG